MIKKLISVLIPLLSFGCGSTENKVSSFTCDQFKVDVLSIKKNPGLMKIKGYRTKLRINKYEIPISISASSLYLPETYTRVVVGKVSDLSQRFPQKMANLYFGDYPKAERKKLQSCLVKNKVILDQHLRKTRPFSILGTIRKDAAYIFWDGTPEHLKISFKAKSGEEILLNEGGFDFYSKNDPLPFNIGRLVMNENGKPSEIKMSLDERLLNKNGKKENFSTNEKEVNAYTFEGKTIAQFLSLDDSN